MYSDKNCPSTAGIQRESWHPSTKGHAVILRELLQVANLRDVDLSTDYTPKSLSFDRTTEIVLPDRDAWANGIPFQGPAIYTDGSKSEEGTGSGVFIEFLNIKESFKLLDNCSVFQTEVYAIQRALLTVSQLDQLPAQPITIFVDIQAALKAIGSNYVKSRLVSSCRMLLRELCGRIRLCWVPGHRDIQGNEIADELARAGAALASSHQVDNVYPPLCNLFVKVENLYNTQAQIRWDNVRGCNISRCLWPHLSKSRTMQILGLRKQQMKFWWVF